MGGLQADVRWFAGGVLRVPLQARGRISMRLKREYGYEGQLDSCEIRVVLLSIGIRTRVARAVVS